jgi:hypothetical protein
MNLGLYSDTDVLQLSVNQTRELDPTSQAIIKTGKTVILSNVFLQVTQ